MKTWIIVADASRARLFEADRGELRVVQQNINPEGRKRDHELVTDRSGRTEKGKGRHVKSALEPRTTPHEVATVRFARALGRFIDDARGRESFQWLAIIAAPHFLGLLLPQLSRRVSDALIASIDKDYVGVPDHEMSALVTEAVMEAARSRQLPKHDLLEKFTLRP